MKRLWTGFVSYVRAGLALMLLILLVSLAALLPTLHAQPALMSTTNLTVHGHPQLALYTTPADWLNPSSQCHWMQQHVHIEPEIPDYAEITGPFATGATLVLFNTTGHLSGFWSPRGHIRDVVWDDTGSATPPDMRGVLGAVKKWHVRFVYDPTLHNAVEPPTTPHGWFLAQLSARAYFDNGDSMTGTAVRSVFSMLDPTKPESYPSDEGRVTGTFCAMNSLRRPELSPYGTQMGSVIAEFNDMLPLLPIGAPWATRAFPYNYEMLQGVPGTYRFPNGTFELRRDLDLHMGIPGVTLSSGTFDGMTNFHPTPVVIEPAVLGSGSHRYANIWDQPDGLGQSVTALTVFTVKVGPNVPAPTTCTDPKATNFGGPLPCVFPPPPPPPPPPPVDRWVTVTTQIQRLGMTDRYRLCITSSHCVEFTMKP